VTRQGRSLASLAHTCAAIARGFDSFEYRHRAVWTRDGGRCAFVGAVGERCRERGFLEWHHTVPYVTGGEATVETIELRGTVGV